MSNSSGRRQIRLSNRALLGLWAMTLVASFFWIGKFIDETADGIDLAQRSLWTFVLAVAIGVVAISATILWARDLGKSSDGAAPAKPVSGRRRFLLGIGGVAGGLVTTFAAGLIRPRGWLLVTGPAIGPTVPTTDPNPRDDWKGARIQSYRRLGRTGFEVSDISLGSGRIRGEDGREARARKLIERGVNYFDTAPDYSEEGSELALGRAMKGHRDKMFLATKFCTPHGHLQAGAPRPPVHGGRRRQPAPPADRPRRPRAHPRLRHARAPARPERARGLRAAEAAGQGALPRLLQPHAQPRERRQRRDRRRPLRRHDARLPPRRLAARSASIIERARAEGRRAWSR